jgi:putative two-component system response regulator
VAIPDQILGKRGRLCAEEMNVMQRHTRIGERVIRATEESVPGAHFLRLAADIARSHHERFDGTGYPEGLAGDAIPLAARIVALADVYDALTSKRPYKEAFPHEKAAAIIEEGRGTQFDPDVVDAFCRRQAEFRKLAARLADEDADALDRLVPELVGA